MVNQTIESINNRENLTDFCTENSDVRGIENLSRLLDSPYIEYFSDFSLGLYFDALNNAKERGKLEHVLSFMFNAAEPNEERIEKYKQHHTKEYRIAAKEYAATLSKKGIRGICSFSSMNAGKSTLAEFICEELERDQYKIFRAIAPLGDSFTHSRVTGEKKEATQITNETIEDFFLEIIAHKGNKLLYFDELTFMNQELIDRTFAFCSDNNIPYIFIGLNKDAFGRTLPAVNHMTEHRLINDQVLSHECMSFTMSQSNDEIFSENAMGNGTHTARYIVFPDGTQVFDLALQLEISKSNKHIKYIPAAAKDHLYSYLSDDYKDVLERVPPVSSIEAYENLEAKIVDHIQKGLQLERLLFLQHGQQELAKITFNLDGTINIHSIYMRELEDALAIMQAEYDFLKLMFKHEGLLDDVFSFQLPNAVAVSRTQEELEINKLFKERREGLISQIKAKKNNIANLALENGILWEIFRNRIHGEARKRKGLILANRNIAEF